MIVGSIILAGGRSRRMGRPKEALAFGDNSLLGRTVDTLLTCTFPVVVVGRDAEQELPPISLEADLVFDDQPDLGPLAGLVAGLHAIQGACEAVFLTGCDAPFLSADAVGFLTKQLGSHDVLMPRVDDVLQPLCAVYRVSVLPTVERLISAGTHMPKALAEACDCRILTEGEIDAFDASRSFLRNVNSPEDYEAALAELEGQS